MSNTLGRHILVEFFDCSAEIMNDVIIIEQSMVNAAREAQATVINSTFHHFSPYGVSGVVVIQESHLAIHTWPEFRYAAVDIFTCGTEVNPWIAYDFLKKAFQAQHGSAMEINRGQKDLLQRVDVDFLQKHRSSIELYQEQMVNGEGEKIEPQFKRDVWFTDKDENRALSIRHTGDVLYRQKSPFQLVQVLDSYAYGKTLTIDGMIMCTEKDEFVYHEMISHVPMLTHPGVKKALVIGGGDGGTVRELVKHESLEQVVMVEIDEKVVEASKLHLPTLSCAFGHPKLDLRIDDGIKYIHECPDETFDLIIIDGSDPEGPAEGLFSEEFYQHVHRCLRPGGLLTLQSEGPHFSSKAFVELHQCLERVFGEDSVHCYLAFIPTYPTGMWSFNYACKDGSIHPLRSLDEVRANAFSAQHQLRYYTADVHKGAFALPPFVQEMLSVKAEVEA
jgi:spermidine synthase